ncbi:phiSA1p31-related protein [Streptomyces sp. NPDC007346]|uniref:DNA polymerase III subunit beta family protein n=1 Tax=Streptomyces sp. NPDC007346 TaxID=3154682 RepID=UPI003455ABF5
MTHISARDLHRMITQVTPHMSDDDTLPVLNAIHLEARNHDLTAVATDRYTFGVARTGITEADRWTAVIPAEDLPTLTAWLKAADTTTISITADGPDDEDNNSTLTLNGNGASVRIAYPAGHYGKFPNWRNLLRSALDGDPQAVPLSGVTTEYLKRWKHADKVLAFFQTGPRKPIVFLEDFGEFIGMQMPTNTEHTTRTQLADRWTSTLTRFAYFEGEGYNLDLQWADKQGDPWEYTGRDNHMGEPLMRLIGIDDDDHTLGSLIAIFGPISAIN